MEAQTYTVTQITQLIRQKIEAGVGTVWVQGEISNLRRQASGITYFTLKDAGAQLGAILFANVAAAIGFEPADGMAVRLYGPVTVYAPQGKYQIVVRQMEQAGQGELMARFEALKQKLKAEGLFDRSRRPLPALPRHIGIVTSPTGAALRDILNILGRRFPNLDILIRGARVQGAGAAEEIALGIERLNAVGDPAGQVLPGHAPLDVIIVTRGGGSLEDLWPFNEEIVARAIAASRLPVISAVGHEIDTTISDLVADLRCPTPSAAAEQVVGRKRDFEEQVESLARSLRRQVGHRLDLLGGRLAAARANRVFSEPGHAVERFRQQLDHLQTRSQGLLDTRCRQAERRCERAAEALGRLRVDRLPLFRLRLERLLTRAHAAVATRGHEGRLRLASASSQLQALNPLAVLSRGYSITRRADGQVVRSVAAAPAGTWIETRLADGTIGSVVQPRPPRPGRDD
jgi:exodeoxyribonuclease VII large subunit